MKMYMRIDGPAEALHKRDRAGLHGGPRGALLHGLLDVVLPDGAADDRMDAGGELSGGRHPIAQRHRDRHDPLPHGHPGEHLLDEMGGLLRHAPPRTGGAKAPHMLCTAYAGICEVNDYAEYEEIKLTETMTSRLGGSVRPGIVLRISFSL